MTSWILIILLSGGHGMAIDHIYFDNKKDCEQAIIKIEAEHSFWDSLSPHAICVESKHD